MARRKITTSVYLDEEQIKRLKEHSAKISVSMAELIRQGIDLILEEQKKTPVLPFPPLKSVK